MLDRGRWNYQKTGQNLQGVADEGGLQNATTPAKDPTPTLQTIIAQSLLLASALYKIILCDIIVASGTLINFISLISTPSHPPPRQIVAGMLVWEFEDGCYGGGGW